MVELTREDIKRILDWASKYNYEIGFNYKDLEVVKKLNLNLFEEVDLQYNGIKTVKFIKIESDPMFVEIEMLNGDIIKYSEEEYNKFVYTLKIKSEVRDEVIGKIL